MKILRLPAYFLPEQMASTHLQMDRIESFATAGFTLVVYAPTPTRGLDDETFLKYKHFQYEELHNGKIQIHRFSMYREGRNPVLRAIRYILVNLIQYYKGVKSKDIDIIYSSSTPPIQGVMCARLKKRLSKKYKKNIPLVYNLQDIFPDSLVATGLTNKGSFLWKVGRKIEDYTYKNVDKIIVISESMRRNILAKGVPEDKIVLISNWIDTETTKPIAKEENKLYEEFSIPRDKYVVLYAGNFGNAQGAEIVLEAAKQLKDHKNIQFVIFGGGAGYENAKKTAESLENVIISSLLPNDRVSEVYSLGDVAIITCKKGIGTSGMPSKTWSIMACDTPIIASFDIDSELAEIVSQANAGVTIEPEDVDQLSSTILEMASRKTNCYTGGRKYIVNNASKEICTAKYVEVIKTLIEKEETNATVG